MTCAYKKYEVKIKMVQKQWLQLKINFLLCFNIKIVIYGGLELTFGGARINIVGESLLRWNSKFSGIPPPRPRSYPSSREKPGVPGLRPAASYVQR